MNQKDVPTVFDEIFDVQTKSELFGRVLKLPALRVKFIHQQHHNPQECLLAVIDEFVKYEGLPPTWRVIVEALRNPLIGLPRLAQGIERKYCPHPPTNEGKFPPSLHVS